VEPADAYLFAQINAGNCLSIPYAKGFGWGADINLRNIFTSAFSAPIGQGYPPERREQQNRNAGILDGVKRAVAKDLPAAIRAIDPAIVRQAITPNFLAVFRAGCKDEELAALVDEYAE
jgi:ribose 5-phosphate isomerase B